MKYKVLIEFNYTNDEEFAGDFSLDFNLCFILVIHKQHERSLKVSAFFVIICYLNILQAVQATASNM